MYTAHSLIDNMLGYTGVMYAEICRLCASNLPIEKVNIFDEQGKQLQLQHKIEMLIQKKVNANDNLPKVVCNKCLLKLEDYYNFRNICQFSESMLSTYYENAKGCSDFKLTGKVYIKNTPATEIDGKKYIVLMKNKNQKNVMDNNVVPLPVIKLEYPEQDEESSTLTIEASEQDLTEPIITMSAEVKDKNFVEHPPPEATHSFEHIEISEEAQQATVQKENVEEKPIETTAKVAISEKPVAKKFVCKECGKTFKRREHLYQHCKLHSGERPYKCVHCEKDFLRKEHLIRHTTSHTGLKNYTCDICSKSFSRNDNLLKHRKTHDKTSDFQCFVCDKKFVMKHYFEAHMAGVHKNLHEVKKQSFILPRIVTSRS